MKKSFNLSIAIDENNECTIATENNGMNPAELVGFLEMKKQDILDQIRDESEAKFKRTAHVDGKVIEVEEVAK